MRKNDIVVKSNMIGGRQGLAYIFNSGEVKSVNINLDTPQEYESYSYWTATKIKVHKVCRDGSTLDVVGNIAKDSRGYEIVGHGACLKADFGFEDVMEMAFEANLPIVNTNEIVAILNYSQKSKIAFVELFKVGTIDIFCQTMARLIPLTAEEMKKVADDANRWVNQICR